ncbi:MAG: hypothetical protein ACJ8AP_13750 [Gemmatimonadales bacterium]
MRQVDQLLATGVQWEGAYRLAGMGSECRRLAKGAGGFVVNRGRQRFLGRTDEGRGSGVECNVGEGDSRWARGQMDTGQKGRSKTGRARY